MKKSKFNFSNRKIIFIIFILLFLLVFSTKYYGSTDVGDYANVAKFFAGEYNAKIRSSHSYFYGFISSPFVRLTNNFTGMKIMSLVWLMLIILSLYYILKKDRKMLLIIISAPIFWYMAPWINPIQIASLFFLWGYYFIKKYHETNKLKNLIYSGLFIGLSWAFWDTILYFGAILALCFLYDKKIIHSFYFIIFILIGLIPRLILDQILFNFAFFTIFKSFTGGFVNLLWEGVSGRGGFGSKTFTYIFPVMIILPLFSYLLLKPKNFKENKRTIFFLILSLLLILSNPQIRYTLTLIPIILLNIGKILNKNQFKIQIIFSIILSILIITPYLVQIQYSTNAPEFTSVVENIRNLEISRENINEIKKQDLDNIARDFPHQSFIVGNKADDYSALAHLYWGNRIKEFVSIQDYELFLENKSLIFEKQFHPIPNIENRREIWIKGGISKRTNDKTDYNSIKYAISMTGPFKLKNFKLIKKYKILSIYKKQS